MFTNASTGDYADSLWAFGDGGTSAEADPVHTYTVPGSYTVTLTVSGLGGTDTEIKPGYVLVAPSNVYLPLVLRDH
jgi:PKD repeat protein